MKSWLFLMTLSTASPAFADAPGWQHRRNLLQEPLPEVDQRQTIDGKLYRISYRADTTDGKAPMGKMHQWTVTVEPKQAPAGPLHLAVVGDMPQHLHGLPTNIEIVRQEDGRFLITGMKFHMVGWWRLAFTVSDGAASEDFVFQLIL